MEKLITDPSKLAKDDVKLKDYLNDAIFEISEDYIKAISNEKNPEILKTIEKNRNILICIREICKQRNKF